MAVDDLADACVHLLKTYSGEAFVNVGTGEDVTIADFARLVAEVVGYAGRIEFDASRPDGMPRKLLDVSRLTALGWRARIGLREGLAAAYADFLAGGGRMGQDVARATDLPAPDERTGQGSTSSVQPTDSP